MGSRPAVTTPLGGAASVAPVFPTPSITPVVAPVVMPVATPPPAKRLPMSVDPFDVLGSSLGGPTTPVAAPLSSGGRPAGGMGGFGAPTLSSIVTAPPTLGTALSFGGLHMGPPTPSAAVSPPTGTAYDPFAMLGGSTASPAVPDLLGLGAPSPAVAVGARLMGSMGMSPGMSSRLAPFPKSPATDQVLATDDRLQISSYKCYATGAGKPALLVHSP